jgi:hypothetical protein
MYTIEIPGTQGNVHTVTFLDSRGWSKTDGNDKVWLKEAFDMIPAGWCRIIHRTPGIQK